MLSQKIAPAAVTALLSLAAAATLAVTVPVAARATTPAAARPAARRPPAPQPGDVMRLFNGARVYVVTNADPALADTLLEGTRPSDRRVMSIEEWRKLPSDIHQYVTLVFLIDRQALAQGTAVPERCAANGDQVWTEVTRVGTRLGVNHTVVLSAPDAAWLRAAVTDFRKLAEPPRVARVRNARLLTVVPLGAGAALTGAPPLLERADSAPAKPNLLTPERWQALQAARRLDSADEVVLIDRSGLGEADAPVADTLSAGRRVGPGDTAAWRERKREGGWRAVITAPNADLLAEALRRYPDPVSVPETATVLMAARDLRSVRRVAVAGLRNGAGGTDLAQRLASRAATELRALDAFEVLERSGLNEVLGEVALGQAGITQAKDRARVRQMAAADALLIVEVTDAGGQTEYRASRERLTPKLGGPPKRPLEPTRLKYAIALPGKENDRVAQAVTEALLARAVGTKSEREYKEALNAYNRVTLPDWQRRVDEYNYQRERRTVEWREQVTPRHTCVVSGSLRLVDLTDGLVLWESPFSLTTREEGARSTRTVTTRGEDSAPDERSDAESDVPPTLVARTAEKALQNAVLALKGTALLPPTSASSFGSSIAGTPEPPSAHTAPVGGRILDIDAGQVLVGLGQTDGVRLGDTLLVDIGGGQTVALVTTRVRPRTCDCAFSKAAPAALTAKVAVGMTAARQEIVR
jgi:hypothetical protein